MDSVETTFFVLTMTFLLSSDACRVLCAFRQSARLVPPLVSNVVGCCSQQPDKASVALGPNFAHLNKRSWSNYTL